MISIIIPCYNCGDTIDECIESAVTQSYNDIEILAIDDGSTDSTGALLDAWAGRDKRVRVFHTENRGRSAARNLGITESKGEYITFIDSDDTIKPTCIDTMFRALIEHDADMVTVSQYCNRLGSGEFVDHPSVAQPTVYNGYFQYVADTYLDKGRKFFQNHIVAWSKLYKRSLFDNISFPEGRIVEDAWIFPEITMRCKKIVVLPDCLYFYRQRPNSTTRSSSTYLVESKFEAWIHNREWWKSLGGAEHDALVAYCEKYICHYMYQNANNVSKEKRDYFKFMYRKMVKHMLFSKNLFFKTKIKYLTFAMPMIVWK